MLDTIQQTMRLLAQDAWRSISGLPAVLAAGASLVLMSPRPRAELPAAPSPAGERAGDGAHWDRICSVIENRIDAAHRAARMQADARTQLDAAEFTLSQILDDLRTLVPVRDNVRPMIAPRRMAHAPRAALAA